MSTQNIFIQGAREHNLKNIDLELPRDSLIVITGLSGSGKSSLAFDTIYAEGQRRYVESLSAYARQFLGQMEKPDVDYIEGLSPAISIDQKGASKNPRSTVGTVTEIYDYLRLLFARIGKPFCPQCGRPIEHQTIDQMVDKILALPQEEKIHILAPVVRGRKGEYNKLIQDIRKAGFVRIRVNGEVMEIPEKLNLHKHKKHTIEVVVDRLSLRDDVRNRLADSLETALKLGQGIVTVHRDANGAGAAGVTTVTKQKAGQHDLTFSEKFACVNCGISFEEIAPRMFSFNSPYGACTACSGLGTKPEIDPDLIVYDKNKSINDRGMLPWGITTSNYYSALLKAAASDAGIDLDTPVRKLSKESIDYLLRGNGDGEPHLLRVHFRNRMGRPRVVHAYFEGIIAVLQKRYLETDSEFMRGEIEKYMSIRECNECHGARLKKETLSIKIAEKSIADVCAMTVRSSYDFFRKLVLTEREQIIAHQILKEIRERLNFLINVGLDYLTIDRTASTLAGGEAQRIRLATQIGSGLMGVLYILDEPSIGLHQRDNERLLSTLTRLRDLGNTVIVVEHDEATMRASDVLVDLGPGAGKEGGQVVYCGSPNGIEKCAASLTGQYIARKLKIPVPKKRRVSKTFLTIKGARQFNLKNITVKIPLGVLACVTGVSGSGKSTLVSEILYKAMMQYIYGSKEHAGMYDAIYGIEQLDKVIDIDQSPIGRTPRSNPATYTKCFDLIRTLFSMTPEARIGGYKPGRFSFNVKGGRCEACEGDGILKIEMHFLPDVYVTCETCKGKRYNRETLEVTYRGKTISDVLNMRVEEALEFYKHIPKIKSIMQTVYDVGLGYVELGQPATTLSGGEAQRIKLSAELARRDTGRTLYLLDEPTTGLHFADIQKLLNVLQRLVDAGNTVLVIEHNLDVIKTADYIIDLGPEGGEGGGQVVAAGTPEDIVKISSSYTGKFLRTVLE